MLTVLTEDYNRVDCSVVLYVPELASVKSLVDVTIEPDRGISLVGASLGICFTFVFSVFLIFLLI